MISDTLVFIKNQLNTHLNLGRSTTELQEDLVVFVEGDNKEFLTFTMGAISVLLINIEEENLLRSPNQFTRTLPNGVQQNVNPDIRLNLYVLFVANFKEYAESLRYLSRIFRYFQNHRKIDQHRAPELSENIEHLVIELITLPFSEQNDIWNALRVAYHPSVLYKVKMVVFRDEDAQSSPSVEEIGVGLQE